MDKPTKESQQLVEEVTREFMGKLEISGEIAVSVDETNAYRVHIDTEETGLLIGYHGKTLESFQIVLTMLAAKKLGAWAKVYVNVGDYREKREESLMYMAQRAADRAIETGRAVELPHLSASERRVVHLTLSGDERVTSESSGEGDRRVLVVKPKG